MTDNKKIKVFPFPLTILNCFNKFNIKPMNISNILEERKKTFTKEYLKMNSISISSTCSVKTDYIYKYGHLTLYNSKLTINQYESNKLPTPDNLTLDVNRTEFNFIGIGDDLKSGEDILYPIFFIDFNLSTCQLIIHKTKKKFRLIVLGRNINEDENDYDNDNDFIAKYRIVKFKMENATESNFKLVCESINKSIILSNGYRNNIFSINLRKNFCKEYFINYKEFTSKANTGDILLFRGYAKESNIQRAITCADYDHVAILFRKDDVLQVYESTGKDGVKLRPWQEFITYLWYLLYEKMAFRALKISIEAMQKYIYDEKEKYNNLIDINMNNPTNVKEMFYFFFNKNVNDFIERTEDRKYSFSKCGYIFSSTMKKDVFNRKGYSCSELAAACYYHCRIITEESDASNYLPGNFSRGGMIHFKPGFCLGEEYIIDFSSSSSSF